MVTELEAGSFSAEDSSNVLISCALSAIAYELLPNFSAILKSTQARQQKIKLLEVMALMAQHTPAFFVTGNRFSDLVEPQISAAIKMLAPSDMLTVLTVKAAATLMTSLQKGLEAQ